MNGNISIATLNYQRVSFGVPFRNHMETLMRTQAMGDVSYLTGGYE